MVPMPRPFLNWSIIQLETEFDRAHSTGDQSAIAGLRHELTFRSVPRANRLREQVTQSIDG
jgi:hypothetical protein